MAAGPQVLPELEENVDNCSVKLNVSQKDGFNKIEQKHENESDWNAILLECNRVL